MQALQQYIDLYNEQHEAIDRHSAPVLNALRRQALQCLGNSDLPSRNDEHYKHTDIEALYAPDYGININRLPLPAGKYESFRCNVPNLTTRLFFLVGDTFAASGNAAPLPDGVLAGSLCEMARQHPGLVQQYYGKIADMQRDGTVALNSLLAQDGFFLYIPPHTTIDKPIQLINLIGGNAPTMSNRRILIIADEGAQAKVLVCDHSDDTGIQHLVTQVTEIWAAPGSVLDYYSLEENVPDTRRVTSTCVHQEEGSNVLVNGITLRNGITRDNYSIVLAGSHAETQLCGMAIADGDEQVDVATDIDHRATHCHSNELFKFVLNDRAQGAFAGRIIVQPGAQKTEAYQSNKNLCASTEAHMYSKPQLEIYADDVKCSHGATVGQLDARALFYMRTRGISETEARMLLMFAFMSDVIDHVRLDALKERLRQLVEKRFRGELSRCNQCTMHTADNQ